MLIPIIIIVIATTCKPSEAGLLSNSKVETKEDLFCQQLGFEKPSSLGLVVKKKSATESLNKFQNCTETVKPYFAKYEEEEATITKFADYLKKHSMSYEKGISYMTHLRNYDWNMENVIDLFDTVDCSKFQIERKCFNNFFIYREQWYRWKQESFNVGDCLNEYDGFAEDNPDGKKGRDTTEEFMKWLSAGDNKNNNKCTCDLVFGIAVIKEWTDMTGNFTYSLQDYFNICLTENLPPNKWTKNHYKSIGRQSSNYTIEDIKLFLTQAVSLAKDNLWGYKDVRGWEFDAVAKHISIKNQDLSEDEFKTKITMLTYVIDWKFSVNDFDYFLTMTDNFGAEFLKDECKFGILKASFVAYDNTSRKRNNSYWIMSQKKDYLDHLNQLYEIFKSGNDTPKDCSTFASLVNRVEVSMYERYWSVDKVRESIKKGGEEKQSLQGVYQYLDTII